MQDRKRKWSDIAPLPLRLVLGFGFAFHGFPKLFSSQGHASFVGMLQGLGIPSPDVVAWGLGAFEFFGGIALIAGAFTVVIAALAAIEMAAAAWLVHLPNGFNFINMIGTENGAPVFGMPGYEVNLLYIAGFLSLILSGAGVLSIDRPRARPALAGAGPSPEAERAVPDGAWTGRPREREREEVISGRR